ncbi:SDR family oxidoreductase [Compostimonas suwonensis]|uniref:SDR family oxidoreductase n=1 Tax=Compostimonas suwonensis TaxID=1048394 RepID=UPI001FE2A04F|nr:SDR family NAD(P)-dependent oxidoreductase [Compostimonas suwonensis]
MPTGASDRNETGETGAEKSDAREVGVIGTRVVWVVGAGSGMGRAVAISAAAKGHRVAVSGRRADALAETARLIEQNGGTSLVLPLDVSDPDAVAAARAAIESTWSPVSDLVYAAGLNTPRRYWRDQSITEFTEIVQTNLIAAARLVDAVLPGMRERRDGVVVVVSSHAGWRFSPDAGVAYSASKTALGSLCESLNAQEGVNGIRTTHVCPGDVDTDFLSMRPNVPDAQARTVMLTPDDIARSVQFVLDSPPHVRIDELVITPTGKAATR